VPYCQALRVASPTQTPPEDFIHELAGRGFPPSQRTLWQYLILLALEPLRSEPERTGVYSLEFLDYDWSLNEKGTSTAQGGGGSPQNTAQSERAPNPRPMQATPTRRESGP